VVQHRALKRRLHVQADVALEVDQPAGVGLGRGIASLGRTPHPEVGKHAGQHEHGLTRNSTSGPAVNRADHGVGSNHDGHGCVAAFGWHRGTAPARPGTAGPWLRVTPERPVRVLSAAVSRAGGRPRHRR